MKDASNRFRRWIVNALTENAGADPLPQRLFHFTDADGLSGILTSRQLRMNHAQYLNDPTEIEYSQGIARLATVQCRGHRAFRDHLLGLLDGTVPSSSSGLHRGSYIASFADEIESSYPWLHYGRSGTGSAIAFSIRALSGSGPLLYPVIYDREQQTRLFGGLVDGIARDLAESFETASSAEERLGLTLLASEVCALGIRVLAPICKNPVFKQEREWRLVHPDLTTTIDLSGIEAGEARSRSVNGRLVPYHVLNLPLGCIAAVVLGYSSPIQVDDRSLRVLLRSAGSEFAEITRSMVPVRPR